MIFKKRAVLVDLDGTLANSLEALKNIYYFFLKQFGIQGTEEEFDYLNGLTLPQVVTALKKKYCLDPSLGNLEGTYTKLIEMAYTNEITPYCDGVEVLRSLKENGAILGLVTAAKASLATAFLKKHQLENIFDAVITPLTGEPGKPDPALYLRALNTFKLSPDEVVVIEDSRNGVQAALTAGIETVWIFHKKEEVMSHLLKFANNWNDVKKKL